MSGLRIVLQRVGPGQWMASCSQWRSLAQGDSAEEALKNLTELIDMYPDLVANSDVQHVRGLNAEGEKK